MMLKGKPAKIFMEEENEEEKSTNLDFFGMNKPGKVQFQEDNKNEEESFDMTKPQKIHKKSI